MTKTATADTYACAGGNDKMATPADIDMLLSSWGANTKAMLTYDGGACVGPKQAGACMSLPALYAYPLVCSKRHIV